MKIFDYWRNHAIEIVVIVCSILLAFAIEAAWNSRNESIREKQLLTFIYADMASNVLELEHTIEYNQEQSTGLNNFMKASPETLSQLTDSTSVSEFMQVSISPMASLYSASVFTPYQGSLVESNLSEIGNVELRNELGAWLGLSYEVVLTTSRNLEGSEALRSIAAKHGTALLEAQGLGVLSDVLSEEPYSLGETLSALRADEGFISSLLLYHNQRQRTYIRLEPLRESTERVMLLLQENM